MNPKYLSLQKTDDQFLGHVVEECGEVLQMAGKIQRFGWNNYHPECPPEEREANNNKARLKAELDDLKGAIGRLEERVWPKAPVRPAQRRVRFGSTFEDPMKPWYGTTCSVIDCHSGRVLGDVIVTPEGALGRRTVFKSREDHVEVVVFNEKHLASVLLSSYNAILNTGVQ